MTTDAEIGTPSNYFQELVALVRRAVTQLVRPPLQPQPAAATRRLVRVVLPLTGIAAVVIVALIGAVDLREISLMPPRGTASLWPVRILTDFGKAANVLWPLAAALAAVALLAPRWPQSAKSRLLRLGTRLEFVFFAVLVPVLAGEVIKGIVGRGRPFVGGEVHAFNSVPFAATEAYASFPSAHAITSCALAFAISALWPRARVAMAVYAVLICASRLVLLAHHPSDVIAGALIGVVGAMLVRYWFAARGLGFAIAPDGAIAPLDRASPDPRKGVARKARAP
jgi:membrane-associated phospholipid phosphatase